MENSGRDVGRTFLIIAAGGIGKRMGSSTPKQFLELNGKSILQHTITAFNLPNLFYKTIIVLPQDHAQSAFGNTQGSMANAQLIPGGNSRQASIFNALTAIKNEATPDDLVCIHDGVRPFVTKAEIMDCLNTAQEHGTAVLGVPMQETVKRTNVAGQVTATVSRTDLWLAKTPQVARFKLLWQAYTNAQAKGITATDDAALLEATGVAVFMVPGSTNNLKITTPQDLLLAEKILQII